MESPSSASLPFLPLGIGRHAVRLRCLRPCPAGGGITAWLQGIALGRVPLVTPVTTGEVVEVPVRRLPLLQLPAELRFADDAGQDLAPPWRLESIASATELAGTGRFEAEALRLDQGMLRGLAVNRVNGLHAPVLFARVNGSVARGVAVEAPLPLPEGGAGFAFSLPLHPADLTDSGLEVTLHAVGLEAPLASFAYHRSALENAEQRLVALEARLRAVEGQAAAAAERLMAEQRQAAARQQARIDAFTDHIASLILDRLANTASTPDEAEDPRLAALRRLVNVAAEQPAPALLPLAAEVVLAPSSPNFTLGWHYLESDPEGEFRWMAESGLVVVPDQQRPLRAVRIAIPHVYGGEAPSLLASLDDRPARLALTPLGGGRWQAVLTPETAMPTLTLRLDSQRSGSPAQDGHSADARLLSFAVGAIAFDHTE